MSIDALPTRRVVPCRTLAEYLQLLLARLAAGEPAAAARIREVVGARRARITLDAESADVFFADDGTFHVEPPAGAVAGTGTTFRGVVLDLLDGYEEVTTAVLDGELELTGTVEDVAAIGQAIEIVIDSATRVPPLQELARDFRDDPCRPSSPARLGGPPLRRTPFYPDPPDARERELLRRLDLLP